MKDPTQLEPILQEFWPKLRELYMKAYPGRALVLTHTYRTPEEQKTIYDQNKPGAILTRCDGYIKKSMHNYFPSKAFDIAVFIKGKAQWDDVYYKDLGKFIDTLGYTGKIRWGGWFSFRDYCHFETMEK